MVSIGSFSALTHSTRFRLVVMAAGGLAVAVAVGLLGSRAYAPVLGWAASSLIYLVSVWSVIWSLDASQTSSHALRVRRDAQVHRCPEAQKVVKGPRGHDRAWRGRVALRVLRALASRA